ncbi:MAG: bifunctional phosphopantothenoylcysteine decarboxylase/phosphopantothenate--cysteine ligase CoaBC [candidate division Zixibacteria bacterium]
MFLSGRQLVVGLTGGVSCYKVPNLVRLLYKEGASVQVIMTKAATKFITPLTLESVSQRPVAIQMFPKDEYVATRHIDYSDWAELIIIAPATANFMGKIATGISDDLLTTVVTAHRGPILIAPAMNPGMWENTVTQKNYNYLKELGHKFVDPVEGEMACDHEGVGRMAEPEDIFEAVKAHLLPVKKKSLSGKKVLITAGPTREKIDAVRFISNYSSGKMGYALAQAAIELGAETTLISGPSSLAPPPGTKFVSIESTEQLYQAVTKEFANNDCLIMAAAPSDFKPENESSQKIKRNGGSLKLSLQPTVDILKSLTNGKKKSQLVIGFALETSDAIANATKKLNEKNLDAIVVNKVSTTTGFNSDTNQVTFIARNKEPIEWPLLTKLETSRKLLEVLSSMI